MTVLEQMQRIARGDAPPPGIATLLGFTLPEVERGRAVFELATDERHANPMGTVHGGVLCDLADAAMGTAYGTLLEEGESYTTLELKMNFLRPVWRTTLRAEGKLVGGGRTVGLAEARVTDDRGRLVAFATSTLMTLRGEQAAGR